MSIQDQMLPVYEKSIPRPEDDAVGTRPSIPRATAKHAYTHANPEALPRIR